MQQLAQIAAEAGPSGTSRVESASSIRPTMGGKGPCKEFTWKGLMKKPQKYQPGMVALHEICQYQKSTKFLICKCPFVQLVQKIAQECWRYDLHFQVHVVMALHEAAEYYLTALLEDANMCTIHAKHVTIKPRDIQLAHDIHREHLHYYILFWYSVVVGCVEIDGTGRRATIICNL